MKNDKAKYNQLLNTETEMFNGHYNGHISHEEYVEVNEVSSAIEQIFENKYGEDEVRQWRLNNTNTSV